MFKNIQNNLVREIINAQKNYRNLNSFKVESFQKIGDCKSQTSPKLYTTNYPNLQFIKK